MKYFNRKTENDEVTPDVNLSPMIDMVFLLLIFFMVTTVFVQESGVSVNRPNATTAQPLPKESLLISLTAQGDLFFAGKALMLDQVRNRLQDELGKRQLPVIILADREAPAGSLIKLIDQCKLAGAQQVSVAATPEP